MNALQTMPVPRAARWAQVLARVAAGPLAACPAFPQLARRHEDWWQCAATDRPLLLAYADTRSGRPGGRGLGLLHDAEAWLADRCAGMARTRCLGDGLPSVRVDLGPAALGPLLGAPVDFSSDTTWTHACIADDWHDAPDWIVRDDNVWWQRLRDLTSRLATEAAGRFLVCAPDLGGAADTLLNMRGPAGLCMDSVDQPERIRRAMDAIYPAWHRVITTMYDLVTDRGAGLIHWLGLWSSRPYALLTCDFNDMLGPEPFRDVCLPDLARLAGTLDRGLFHLDGPSAARHIEDLLGIDALDAIQFTPGAGTPSTLPWVDMFRRIQARGKAVLVLCPAEEVLDLCARLEPAGLAVIVDESDEGRLEQLDGAWTRRYA